MENDLIGKVVGDAYEILKVISSDQDFVNYLAYQKIVPRNVLVRTLKSNSPEAIMRFTHTIKRQSALQDLGPEGPPLDFGQTPDGIVFAVFAEKPSQF